MAGTDSDSQRGATYRAMLAVVIILGILLVLAFAALVVGGIMKFSHRASAAPVYSSAALTAELPPGARITSVTTSGNRVVIALKTTEGEEVDIFDTDTGRPVARIRTAPPQVLK